MNKIIGIILILASLVLIVKAEEVGINKSDFNMISARKSPPPSLPQLPTGEYLDKNGEKRKKSLDSEEDWRYNPSTKVWWRYLQKSTPDCIGGG